MNKKNLIILTILFLLIIIFLNIISCIFKPKVEKKVYLISEKIYVGESDPYNSFIGALKINIQVNWTPTNQILAIVLVNLDTSIMDSKDFYNGTANISWNVNPEHRYKILIRNINTNNRRVIEYNGTITVSYQQN